MTDGERLAVVIGMLIAAFPSTKAGEATVRVYVRDLADLPVDEVERAAILLRATVRFLPTIAEIRATVAEERLGLPSPIEAWEIVAAAAFERKRPPEGTPSEVIRAREIVGGASAIRETTNPSILRAQFLAAYDELRRHAVGQEASPKRLAAARTAVAAIEPPKGLPDVELRDVS